MRKEKFEKLILLVLMTALGLSAIARPAAGQGGARADEQKCSGTWHGSYTNEDGGTGDLSYLFSKDEQGRCRGSVKYTNQDGEHAGEFTLIELADSRFKGQANMRAGAIQVTMEGELRGDQLSGTYSITARNSSDIIERGTWKLTRSSNTKPAQ